jgi:hypothetical protein
LPCPPAFALRASAGEAFQILTMRPLSLKPPKPFKNLNAPYRMVFINENTMEEVASFHLTKKSLYTLFSSIFIVTIVLTVIILLFTPLRYYVPGYGSNADRKSVIRMERRLDSLSRLVQAGQEQADRISTIIAGKDVEQRDTAMLKPALLHSQEGILPAPEDIKEEANAQTKKEKRNGRRKR